MLDLIDGNVRHWAWSTIMILRGHYEEVRQAETHLHLMEIAIKWARRNLGRRFNLDTVDEVQLYLITKEGESASITCPGNPSNPLGRDFK